MKHPSGTEFTQHAAPKGAAGISSYQQPQSYAEQFKGNPYLSLQNVQAGCKQAYQFGKI